MFIEIFKQAWTALGRNPVRSFLTMSGISWGIVAVTILLSYGAGFRSVLMYTFEVFGKGAVVAGPAQPANKPAENAQANLSVSKLKMPNG